MKKQLKILKSKLDGHTDTSWEWTEAVRLAINALDQTRWIPVSERLPDKIGMYLVTLDYKVLGNSVTMLWFHGKEIGWDLRFSDIVIAWMPLPEPYKAENENRPEFLREYFNKPIKMEKKEKITPCDTCVKNGKCTLQSFDVVKNEGIAYCNCKEEVDGET